MPVERKSEFVIAVLPRRANNTPGYAEILS